MTRTGGSFNRGRAKYQPQKTVLVLCEDSQSGKNYLEDANAHFRSTAEVEISFCGKTDPLGIVKEGISRASNYDFVYCAIDRDRHPSFDRAVALVANHRKVKITASYPCFEYWFLLHFGYTGRPYVEQGRYSPAEVVVRDLKKKEGFEDYDKGSKASRFDQLVGPRLEEAMRLAKRSRADSEMRGDPNPSTAVDVLIELFQSLSKPQESRGRS